MSLRRGKHHQCKETAWWHWTGEQMQPLPWQQC
uniref:Uncharacterized protein n=1 Tax=Arundo donax TaxID=35708 RepID=A0A0A9SUD7_ARUDO